MAAYTITDRELSKIEGHINKRDRDVEKAMAGGAVGQALAIGVGIGSAFGFGYLRGHREDPNTGAWNLATSTIDVEAAAVVGLTVAAFASKYNPNTVKLSPFLTFAAAGIGGHYAGQIGRKMARTGKFSAIAGVPGIQGVPGIGALPQYAPVSYDPTQFSAPYSDDVAASLASSGM